jgi:beta-lactamase regulating signal transducer with metallopeptidase domain
MAELSRFVIDWWLRCAVAGGVLLLVGYLVISLTRQPAKKLAAGFWTLVIALLLPPLTLLPGWLALPWQSPFAAPQRQVVKQEVKRDIATVMTPQQREKAIAPTEVPLLDEVWDQPIPEAGWRSSVPVPASASPKPTAISPARDTSPQSAVEMPAVPEKSWGIWLAWIGLLSYGVVGFWFAFKLLVGQVGLIRLWRSGRPVPNAIRQLFDRMTRHLEHKPEVRITDRVAGPICFGVFRPRIMLQAGLGHGSDTQTLRWIFAHELSHVERKDPLTGWLLGFAQAIYFFCPWFWWLRRDVRLSQEFLADAAAIDDRKGNHSRLTSSATDYADFLVRMASCRAVPIGAAGVRGTTSDLFRRVKMLVQKSQKMEGTCSRRWSLLAGGGLLTLGIALAGFYLPTNSLTAAQAPEKKEAKKAEPTKPADPADDDDEIRKAVEELKKGPTQESRSTGGSAQSVWRSWSRRFAAPARSDAPDDGTVAAPGRPAR